MLGVVRRIGADVVALQEVYEDDVLEESFVRALGKLGYGAVISGRTMRKGRRHYGNIVMTSLPVLETDRVDLSVAGAEPRGAIRLLLDSPFGRLGLVGGHLGLSWRERRTQLERLRALYRKPGPEVRAWIFMGDFNEWFRFSGNLRKLRRDFKASSRLRTFPSRFPVFALDWIGVRGDFSRASFSRPSFPEARSASDHRPLVAEVAFGEKEKERNS